MSTPSARNWAACVWRRPWAWTRLSMPARAARRFSKRRTWAADIGWPRSVQKTGWRPNVFRKTVESCCQPRGNGMISGGTSWPSVSDIAKHRQRASSQRSMTAAAPISRPTVRDRPPLPLSTRTLPSASSRSLGWSQRSPACRGPSRAQHRVLDRRFFRVPPVLIISLPYLLGPSRNRPVSRTALAQDLQTPETNGACDQEAHDPHRV